MRALLVPVLAIVAGPALAAGVFDPRPPLGPYEARTIVTGTDLRSRPAGLAVCLADVLVKVSGDAALASDPRVRAVDPAPLVADYDYVDRLSSMSHHDDQGSSDRPFYFTVRFEPSRIDAVLHELGETRYDGPRPAIVPMVTVSQNGERPMSEGMRAAMTEAADRFGLRIGSGGGSVALRGRLIWSDADHGWTGTWSMGDGGTAHAWSSAGGSYDAAFQAAMRGALGVLAGHPPDGTH